MSTQSFTPEVPTGVVPAAEKESTFSAQKRPGFKVIQPETTYGGYKIQALQKGLPKRTVSLCPECTTKVDATIYEEDGKVYMAKNCPSHGEFRDRLSSDVKLYLQMEQWHFGDNRGVTNPAVANATSCPDDCGLCSIHHSHTVLANVDLTNRCNLTCPVCFANANQQGFLYEPDLAHVAKMLEALRKEAPVAGRIVQFSGGEPTIHPEFIEICRMAKQMGFSHVQAATNGIMLADLEFAQKAAEAGLETLYLQFDGVTDDVYRKTRGEDLLEKKLAAVENCRKTGMKICLVPTIVRGVNDHQVGDILRFAIANIDTISALSYQPVTFTGRINRRELESKRYTLSDLVHAISEQTGLIDVYQDVFPLSCVSPFSKLSGALRGEEIPTLSCHPQCSMGTYMFVDDQTGTATPVTRFMDVGAMLQDMDQIARKTRKATFKFFNKVQAWSSLQRHFRSDKAPRDLSFTRFLQTLQGFTDKRLGRNGHDGKFTYRTLLVAGMHFMDSYNYDVERVKRCVIHYAAPNGQIYPFCAYNSGPVFRDRIEKEFSIALEDQLKNFVQIKAGN